MVKSICLVTPYGVQELRHMPLSQLITPDNDLMDAAVSVNADDELYVSKIIKKIAVQQLSLDALLQLRLRYK